MIKNEQSILLMSDNPEFTEGVIKAFFDADDGRVQTEAASFRSVNGRGCNLAFSKDVVLFEAQPDNEAEMLALAQLLSARAGDTVFLGLSDSDMPIGKARKLRDIGVDDVLPISISQDELTSVLAASVRSRRQRLVPARLPNHATEANVISVAQARGGIGSTAYATNLACQLLGQKGLLVKKTRRKVALIDLDLQFGNANVHLDLEDNGAFQKMVEDNVSPDESYVRGMMQHHPSGLDVLNAPSAVLPLNSLNSEVIGALMDALTAQYEHVVIDLPHALVDWLEPVIMKSSSLHMVMDTSVPSIRHAKRLVDFFRESQIGLPIELIVNREVKPFFKSALVKEAEAVLERPVSHWLPEDIKASRKAVNLGRPVSLSSSSSALSKAYAKVAKSTIGSIVQMTAAPR